MHNCLATVRFNLPWYSVWLVRNWMKGMEEGNLSILFCCNEFLGEMNRRKALLVFKALADD